MIKKTLLIIILLTNIGLQAATLKSGPMLGYSTMREVSVWVQTDGQAQLQLRYWQTQSPEKIYLSDAQQTVDANAFTTHLIADELEPGQIYNYEVLLNGHAVKRDYPLRFQTQALWQWRQDPADFSFALGSCNFVNESAYDRPGRPYGSDEHIFSEILKQSPDFMLWMGDNTYLRETDWNSKTGIYHRYSHTRALPELQPLLGSVHHYANWDDHDYGPDNADRSFWNKHITRQAFKDFWANANYGADGQGIHSTFHWNDVQFFLLDNRWFRSNNDRTTGQRQIFGEQQIQWLIDSLKFSKATFKFVVTGGAFLFNGRGHESAINIAPEERERIIRLLGQEQIPGIVFLSGDVHHSRFIELKRNDAYPLYEWAVSSLTAGPYKPSDSESSNIVPGSIYADHNFGIIEVSGPRKDRQLLLKVIDDEGKMQWSHIIKATQLCRPAACDQGH